MASILKTARAFIPADFRISTWLILGASLECLAILTLPRNISVLPPLALLIYRILHGYLTATGTLPNPLNRNRTLGRTTWQIPSADNTLTPKPSSDSIVVLVLSASWSHPSGRFSPGSAQMGQYFSAMWRDAAAHREDYGFLGNTPGMVTVDDGMREDSEGVTMMYLSYWKTLEGLHKFAHGEKHMKGQLWWERTAMKTFKHLGVMHETYEVPAGNWENVFHNFKPFGIANAKFPVSVSGKEEVEWVSGLRPANGKEWKSMAARMGRKDIESTTS
ncbi:hypothetical protein BCR34DRAFT_553445 [Clohesyomyces aquaticus]|uniref:Uncharacterized protein n=1 Tax=Clohesyomyces aquaticus TaxID=1231657 RepID=A0A1Y2A8C7_9PLEO|nr:hypothetical protein BCR34DRAFT_553445 [Clohesyomyces aquaticus]